VLVLGACWGYRMASRLFLSSGGATSTVISAPPPFFRHYRRHRELLTERPDRGAAPHYEED
jgi:hypothetical protein